MDQLNQPGINEEFFKRLNNKPHDNEKLEFTTDSLRNVLVKQVKLKDLTERLLTSRQEKVTVKEVLLESEIDFINSLKQLKTLFKDELKTAIDRVNDLYTSELLKLQKIYKSEVIGDALLDIVKKIASGGWVLLMKESGVYCYKCYSPMFDVTEGYTEKGTVKVFEEPVCSLKGIYVNILHPQIMFGSILLATEGHHPNVEKINWGCGCAGSLEYRDIPLDDSQKLLELLNEVSSMYQVCHLDSAFYTPPIKFKSRKDTTTWAATGT